MYWFLEALKKYADFSGRARRREYWMYILIYTILALVMSALDTRAFGISFWSRGPFYIIFSLGLLLPSLGVSVRRLHDVGKSGWFLFISLIPLIGAIWLLILDCTEGQSGDNKYGPNPKMHERLRTGVQEPIAG